MADVIVRLRPLTLAPPAYKTGDGDRTGWDTAAFLGVLGVAVFNRLDGHATGIPTLLQPLSNLITDCPDDLLRRGKDHRLSNPVGYCTVYRMTCVRVMHL